MYPSLSGYQLHTLPAPKFEMLRYHECRHSGWMCARRLVRLCVRAACFVTLYVMCMGLVFTSHAFWHGWWLLDETGAHYSVHTVCIIVGMPRERWHVVHSEFMYLFCPVRCWLGTVRELHKRTLDPCAQGSVSRSIGARKCKLHREQDSPSRCGRERAPMVLSRRV
jgi:hypothetical protein